MITSRETMSYLIGFVIGLKLTMEETVRVLESFRIKLKIPMDDYEKMMKDANQSLDNMLTEAYERKTFNPEEWK